jgi:hypothetical protein
MAGIAWQRSPTDLARSFRAYGERVQVAVLALGQFFAGEIESYAKANAPWQDRTGNARQALHAEAVALSSEVVTIYLVSGMDYGKWLELAHGAKYQIILPTLTAFYPQVMARLRALLGVR